MVVHHHKAQAPVRKILVWQLQPLQRQASMGDIRAVRPDPMVLPDRRDPPAHSRSTQWVTLIRSL